MKKEDKVMKILSDVLGIEENEIRKINIDDDLEKYNLESILAMQLVVSLEEAFNIEIDDEDLLIGNMSTISKIMNLIDKYAK